MAVADAISVLLRRGATAVAASRVGVGVVAFAAPLLVSRSWVGRSGDGTPGRVLGRAIGGRDLALGVGALIALRRQENAGSAAVWASALGSAPAQPDLARPAGAAGQAGAVGVTGGAVPAGTTGETAVPADTAGETGAAVPADAAGPVTPAPAAAMSAAATWVGMAAVADGLDLVTTVRSWDDLPSVKRWLVALSSGGAAALGGAAAVSLFAGAIRQRGQAKAG
jgi:hypothetical protein